MEEGKVKFNLLESTNKLIDYVNNLVPNFPKKEVVLKQNLEKTQYELIENIFYSNVNSNSPRIRDKYLKNFLVKLAMYDMYIKISYKKKYISNHQLECVARLLIIIRKLVYGVIRSNGNALSKSSWHRKNWKGI